MKNDFDNHLFNLAGEVINFTSRNLFLTGKAGTGKTTFLKYIREHTSKKNVVVAPTGVAAINAGGVTMHSFFQLPFIPFLPDAGRRYGNIETADRYHLIKNIRFGKEKVELLNELELLIIDEVSMLRADMLDAMDEILRHFRKREATPFGGIQVLLIGDLFQLPPVVKENEWSLLREKYASPFFFSAKVMEQHPPLFIELKKMYRQKEEAFINLLNAIRTNSMNEQDFMLLDERYDSVSNEPGGGGQIITLTSHNSIADRINQQELKKLKGKAHIFAGEIKGEFSDKALPTEIELELKEGAQVMFIKNDSSGEQRYFNGKLAVIKKILHEKIIVQPADGSRELALEKEKWENIRYSFSRESGKVEEEEVGSFTQYPVRLAWAITIHKSQGLTFDKAIIDAGASFAAGQVYVALSRCRTLDGLVFRSRIHPHNVQVDERILVFAEREHELEEIENILLVEKPKFAAALLLRTFDLARPVAELEGFLEFTEEKSFAAKEKFLSVIESLVSRMKNQQEIALTFSKKLELILAAERVDVELLNERVTKAKQYFAKTLRDEFIAQLAPLVSELKGKSRIKQYSAALGALENTFWKKLNDIQRITFGEMNFEVPLISLEPRPVPEKKEKKETGSSRMETLQYYRQGKTPEEIAAQRGFAISTIESHLADLVLLGDVDATDFLTEKQLASIRDAAKAAGDGKLGSIKEQVGASLTYTQIKIGLNHFRKKNEDQNKRKYNPLQAH